MDATFDQPANLATRLFSNGSSIRKNQLAERFRNVEVGNLRAGRPPGRIESRLRRAFHSVEIHAPSSPAIETFDKTLYRDR